jgi:hypothetical protein
MALPATSATGEPKFDPSTTNCTEPVGVGDVCVLLTVAVNVTA